MHREVDRVFQAVNNLIEEKSTGKDLQLGYFQA